jgi:glycerate kinase
MEAGIRLAYPEAEITAIQLADGGEGTMQILTKLAAGKQLTVSVQDPLGRPVNAKYGISADGKTAFIEMAAASGLNLLVPSEYNPLETSTFGTGQLIKCALEQGISKVILGIGGSATNDGGIGMAAALGYVFFDKAGNVLKAVGGNLQYIHRIESSDIIPGLEDLQITVACDVSNPLYGENGAAWVYGPQKGADKQMITSLDLGLRNLADVACQKFLIDVSHTPGAGAAGGLGAGCLWFLNATLKSGIGIVMEQARMEAMIQNSDLVITGEGKVDKQTLEGKVVKGLANICRQHHVPLAVVCGTLDISAEEIRASGVTYATSIINAPMELGTALSQANRLVQEATFNLVRLFFRK